MQDSFFSKAKGVTSSLKDKIADLKDDVWAEENKEIMQEFKDGGVQKIKDAMTNMNGAGAIFQKTGYELKTIAVNLGIPPTLTATFLFNCKISDEERAAIAEEIKDKRMIRLIVSSLLKAEDFADAVKVGDYKLNTVVITLSIAPGVSMTFTKA